ncbi:MAG: hypothetical protein AAGG81_02575 [Chlamydiota bacterium]
MVASSPSEQYLHYESSFITLYGQEETISVEGILKEGNQYVEQIAESAELTSRQKEQLKHIMRDVIKNSLNSEFQANVRLGSSPRTRTFLTLRSKEQNVVDLAGKDVSAVSPEIFERDFKEYSNEEERAEWLPRIQLIERSLDISQLYSLSIVPNDPSQKQNWYCKKVKYQKEHKNEFDPDFWGFDKSSKSKEESPEEQAENLFDAKPKDDELVMVSETMLSEEEKAQLKQFFDSFSSPSDTHKEWVRQNDISYSKKPETPDSPAQQFAGFFAPFDQFSSDLARPQYRPGDLPYGFKATNVYSSEKFDEVIGTLDNPTTQEKVRLVIEAFREDAHSSGLSMVLIQPSKAGAKKLYFTKENDQ